MKNWDLLRSHHCTPEVPVYPIQHFWYYGASFQNLYMNFFYHASKWWFWQMTWHNFLPSSNYHVLGFLRRKKDFDVLLSMNDNGRWMTNYLLNIHYCVRVSWIVLRSLFNELYFLDNFWSILRNMITSIYFEILINHGFLIYFVE